MSEIHDETATPAGAEREDKEIRQAVLRFLECYLVERDIEATLACFSPQASAFGIEEAGTGREALRARYARAIAADPGAQQYTLLRLEVQAPRPGVGIAACELALQVRAEDASGGFDALRLSLLLVKTGQGWLIEHEHQSLPGRSPSHWSEELEEQNANLRGLVMEKTRQLNEALQQLSQLATSDPLTGLFSRNRTNEILDGEINRSQRYNNQFAAILIDIDFFKKVNDAGGRAAGDQVLSDLSAILRRRVRRNDAIGRWAGEEFLVICPETGLGSGLQLAEELRTRIAEHPFPAAGMLTVSLGVSSYRQQDTRETFLARVEAALYEAKRSGRNQVVAR